MRTVALYELLPFAVSIIGSEEKGFRGAAVDSRVCGEGSLFAALPGERTDGHRFIPELIDGGVRAFLIARSFADENKERLNGWVKNDGAAFLVAEDVLETLQSAAEWYLSLMPQVRRIGIPISYDFSGRWNEEYYLEQVAPYVDFAFASCGDAAEEEITLLLRQRHNITGKKEDDFIIRNLTQMMESAMEASQTFSVLLAAIASISLLVGGIGIMNIMLVSVTERTREIGIRMAIGAKAWDIRLQFLVEALVLSLTGGLLGIALGISVAMGIKTFAPDFLPIGITLFPMVISFVFSGLVGICFGFFPAYKASTLNPIDALRFE